MKSSGLADSPLFIRTPSASVGQSVPLPQNKKVVERSTERTNDRTVEPTPERTNDRSSLHSQKTQSTRNYHRYTYDIFDDQVAAIDELTFKRRKTQGRHVTKGQVIRELLDQALKTNERANERLNVRTHGNSAS